MSAGLDFRTVDVALAVIAGVVNVLMIGVFLSRVPGWRRLERILGLIVVGLAVPVLAGTVANAMAGRAWWAIVLPLPFVALGVVELVLDYILALDFRHTRLLGPYLALYYVALMGLIGYAFAIGRAYGFAALGTYFIGLFATWYSYAHVGHGRQPAGGRG